MRKMLVRLSIALLSSLLILLQMSSTLPANPNAVATEELVQAVLDYPHLVDVMLFNTIEMGIESVKEKSEAYAELLKREDGAEKLAIRLPQLAEKDDGSSPFIASIVAILLTEDSMYAKLSKGSKDIVTTQIERIGFRLDVDEINNSARVIRR